MAAVGNELLDILRDSALRNGYRIVVDDNGAEPDLVLVADTSGALFSISVSRVTT